ncbi:MucB/RseB C-terminal domain-containing protein [Marinobacter sp. V034]|uniref:MucB/RseB C-terminal domain-containing protein n=1 Tax=Marinobacter sp. V034 TaxID=3459610 RepID=UPI0040445EB9
MVAAPRYATSTPAKRPGVRWVAACMALLTLCLVPHVSAADSQDQAEAWLEKLGPALNTTSYRGVFVYSRGEQVSSMRIAHRFRDGQVQERLVIQDGAQGEIVRRGGRVYCVLPSHANIQLDAILPSGPFSGAFTDKLMPFKRWYVARMLDDDRVAGHEAVVVALSPRDMHRYQYRLWLEKNTGLLVKSQVRTAQNDILERFQFTVLDLAPDIPDKEFEIQSAAPARTFNIETKAKPAPDAAQQVTIGWKLGWHPQGFEASASSEEPRGQAVSFSDGLASFSVFVTPVGDMRMPTGISRIGATTVFMRNLKDGQRQVLVTVVGEIPPKTAVEVANSVSLEPENSSHLATGMAP